MAVGIQKQHLNRKLSRTASTGIFFIPTRCIWFFADVHTDTWIRNVPISETFNCVSFEICDRIQF